MQNELAIGKALKPRGLKGEVKIETFSGLSARYKSLKHISVDGKPIEIESVSAEGVFVYFKISGIDSAEQAEALRGKIIYAARADLPPPPEGGHYVADLIGSDVFVGGENIGELAEIQQYGSADVYVINLIDARAKTVSVPAIRDLVKEIDAEHCKIVLDDKIFPRVAIFN